MEPITFCASKRESPTSTFIQVREREIYCFDCFNLYAKTFFLLCIRFDLLYLILDRVDEDADRQLARHLVSLYMEDQLETAGVDVLVNITIGWDKIDAPNYWFL